MHEIWSLLTYIAQALSVLISLLDHPPQETNMLYYLLS